MGLGDWLQPPRRLIALFLLVTLVPSLALIASGWRLLEQDRALSLNQLSERREQAADLAVLELEQVVAQAEEALGDQRALRAAASDGDGVGVIFGGEHVDVFPSERLSFYPRTEAGAEAPAQHFAEGEDLEFRQQALPAAMLAYRGLARSPDPGIRAGALIRLARTLRKAGEREKALAVYAEVAQLSGVAVGGVPADILARWARCESARVTREGRRPSERGARAACGPRARPLASRPCHLRVARRRRQALGADRRRPWPVPRVALRSPMPWRPCGTTGGVRLRTVEAGPAAG